MKAIKSLENIGISLKELLEKPVVKKDCLLIFVRPLMTAGSPLMKNFLTLLAKSFLLAFGLSAGMSAADTAIQKKIYGSGTTALIFSNGEMEDIIKIVKSLEESGLLMQRISETIKNETKEQKGIFIYQCY